MAWALIGRRATGILDISGELENGWTGALFVERDGGDVIFRGSLDGTAATSDATWSIPTGFRPGTLASGGVYDYGTGVAYTNDNPPKPIRINYYSSRLTLIGARGLSKIFIDHRLRTRDAMPTTLPGVRV